MKFIQIIYLRWSEMTEDGIITYAQMVEQCGFSIHHSIKLDYGIFISNASRYINTKSAYVHEGQANSTNRGDIFKFRKIMNLFCKQ